MARKELKVIITVGISASGKTTWSKEHVRKNAGWCRVSRDDFRFMLKDSGTVDVKIESIITKLVEQSIIECLNRNENVIVDATHLKVSHIERVLELVKHKADVTYRVFELPVDKAIERDKGRGELVGKEAIKKQYEQYKVLIDSFAFQDAARKHFVYKEPNIDPKLPKAVIFDVDGTLAHMNGMRGPFDWNKVDRDEVDRIIKGLAITCKNDGFEVLVVSGRDASCMELTKEWLTFYGIPFDAIFMRPENDMRKDSIIKKEIYENDIQHKYAVHFVVDDRQQVVDQWRSMGLKVLQCEEGNF